ncbi:kinase-like protein [Auriscalpium vulgare]|uniref:Kinase-like protein n=1 Tax=Auriscalpium vulgare TaxID=40419 RepID=A0ACB8REV0_9AGAM|nr:kinase-like protein [Auriscalpium vulgare]
MLLSSRSRSSSHHFSIDPPPTRSPSLHSQLSFVSNPSDPLESLENYTLSPVSDSPPHNALTSSSSKTNAFFASPFPTISPPVSPPPSSHSKTAAFFSSPFTAEPTPPPSASHHSTPYRDIPSASRSLTADFFSTALSSRPTPTPSLRSVSSSTSLSLSQASSPVQSSFPLPPSEEDVQATPTPKHQLPSLARLFPSRYSSNTRNHEPPRSAPAFVSLEEPLDIIGAPSSLGAHAPSSLGRVPHELLAPASTAFASGSAVHPEEGKSPSYELITEIGSGAFSHVWMGRALQGDSGLVAVKMIARGSGLPRGHKAGRGERASFLREVEVLQHLTPAHPSLPVLHSSFTMSTHHVLVLEYISGGELLDVVNSDEQHARLTEGLLRRMWRELVGAVEWMHSRSVVHRDIKLENILLTTNPFTGFPPENGSAHTPLIKLTDFGLARVIDVSNPWLSTRCGSESYAAPELLVAAHPTTLDDESALIAQLSRAPSEYHGAAYRFAKNRSTGPPAPVVEADVVPRSEGSYDGRETDAWALGVVLFALAARQLPFGTPPEDELSGSTNSARLERQERARRQWVMRVVRGEWAWPEVQQARRGDGRTSPVQAVSGHDAEDGVCDSDSDSEGAGESAEALEASGSELSQLPSVRSLVSRLLVSNPRRRARIHDLWDDPWMREQPSDREA